MPDLEIRNLHVRAGEKEILRGLELTVGKGEIHVFAAREGENIVIDVIDNGIGLPRENRQRLLEPYVTTREKGTGLGLAIVTKIIEEHGGRVELLDAPATADGGQGAMIHITLPRAEPAASAAVAEEAKVSVG